MIANLLNPGDFVTTQIMVAMNTSFFTQKSDLSRKLESRIALNLLLCMCLTARIYYYTSDSLSKI